MDSTGLGDGRRSGSVKAAVNFYGEEIADIDSSSMKKPLMDFSVKPSSRTIELHKARRDIGRYKDSRWIAEAATAQAESELSNANKTVKHLSSTIDESSNKTKAQMRDIEILKEKSGRKHQDGALVVSRNNEYAQVMRELEYVKRELFKLKLDVASVLEEKSRAEKEIEAANSNILSCSRKIEALRKEIEEANEEQVIAELARIEALKEIRDIEAQRETEAKEFELELECKRKKLKEVSEEIDESKELEMKLAVTMSDVDVLQNELNLINEMEKRRVQGDESMKQMEGSSGTKEESGDSTLLETLTEELALIREEGFQFMASMDVIRNKLKHVTAEAVRLKKQEGKVDSTVLNLKSKILRAKSKLEAVSAAEEKAKSIVISLSNTLDNLKKETEAAKKEKEIISQDITTTKEEIKKTEFQLDMTEERSQDVMQELEAIKTNEALALEKLKTLTETTMRDRASLAAHHSSLITVSKFEYEYLTNHAAAAEEIADKKVVAAQAWIEALKASEKEVLIKSKIADRELKETKLEEEMEVYTKERMLSKRFSRKEMENWPRKSEKSSSKNMPRAMSRKSIKSNISITLTPSRRLKFQKSASPASRPISPFTIKKRKKVIPNLAKVFGGKKKSTRSTK